MNQNSWFKITPQVQILSIFKLTLQVSFFKFNLSQNDCEFDLLLPMIDDPLTLLDFNLSLINQNTLIFLGNNWFRLK